jgi:hypothetical protein
VRSRLELPIAAFRLLGELVIERSVNVSRKGVMAFDEVGVVAVHRTHEIAHRGAHHRVEASGQPMSLGNQVGRQVLKLSLIIGEKRFHRCDRRH